MEWNLSYINHSCFFSLLIFFIMKQFCFEHIKEKFDYQSEQLGHSLYNFATPLKSLAFLGTKRKMLVEWRGIFF